MTHTFPSAQMRKTHFTFNNKWLHSLPSQKGKGITKIFLRPLLNDLKNILGSCSHSPQPPFQISQLWLEALEERKVESGVLTHIRVLAPESVHPGCTTITTRKTKWPPYCLPLKVGKSTWVLFKEQEKPGPRSIVSRFPEGRQCTAETVQWSRAVREHSLCAQNVWIHVSVSPLTWGGSSGKLLNYS